MSLDLTDDKSVLVQVMPCCRQTTSHYMHQFWHRSMSTYGVTRLQWVHMYENKEQAQEDEEECKETHWQHYSQASRVRTLLQFFNKNLILIDHVYEFIWHDTDYVLNENEGIGLPMCNIIRNTPWYSHPASFVDHQTSISIVFSC